MQVKFKRTWFAPSEAVKPDEMRTISGQRFQKGIHEVPDEMKEHLPSDAIIILDDEQAAAVDAPEMTLQDYDEARASSDALIAAEKLAKTRTDNLAKARETKVKNALKKAELMAERSEALRKNEERV